MEGTVFSTFHPERWESVPRGLPLVISLQGFSDAGNAVDQLTDHIHERDTAKVIGEFSNDEFLDYRARRPTVSFVKDHLAAYQPETLTLYLAEDELGVPFLFLAGYEPDFRWERFVNTVVRIITDHKVSVTTWVHAIPMPVPHTRPIGTTVSGNMEELIRASSLWQPTTQLSASVGHAIEHRLYNDKHAVSGFVLLIPHYLSNTHYPQALLTSLECIMDATGLLFSTSGIVEKQEAFSKQVDEQIAENAESLEMVSSLEKRYDEFMRERSKQAEGNQNGPISDEEGDIPTAEQLASQLEDYLAKYWGDNPPEQNGPQHPPV